MKKSDFCHLHVHTDFSLLDGACRIDKLVDAARRRGMTELAITDHGNLFGVIQFYQAASAAGIKPLIGFEAYVAPGSRFERETRAGGRDVAFHMTLLAMNRDGYHNLIRLSTTAFLDGFYYKPRIDLDCLSEYSGDIVCLTGCLSSRLNSYLLKDDLKGAEAHLEKLLGLFGRERLFIEVQNHHLEEQKRILPATFELAERMDLRAVATNDVHYISADDAAAHDALLCINTGKLISDEDRMRLGTQEFFLKDADEMRAAFPGRLEVITNTRLVAEMCNVDLRNEGRHEPQYQPPAGKTPEEYLRELAREGLSKRYDQITDEIRRRLDYELGVIHRTGYDSYYLVVWDFVHYAKERGIPVGPGRGSGCGSLVAYAIGITDIDPIKYNILFERFLDEGRADAPDFDIDFDPEGREEVIEYVRAKYGAESMAQIITFGTMAARGVIRDAGRVLGIPLDKVDRIAKLVPASLGITLNAAIEQVPELKDLQKTDPDVKKLFDIAFRLEGLHRHASVHAAGVVIADAPLVNYVPLCKVGDAVATQFSMDLLEHVGLIKMDFLGLRTLTHLKKTVANIKKTTGREIDLLKIPLDDPATFELFSSGNSLGVFQCESAGFRDLLVKLRPDKFGDIVALVALYRPGPLGGGMVDDYVNRKHGREPIPKKHPGMDEVLEDTYGVMVYQDQVMMMLKNLGGLSMAKSYDLIKAISKKKNNVIKAARDDFLKGCKKNKVPQKLAEDIFQLIEYFGGYGFNKSHSAAYALVAYQTAYLKAHYPKEFMAGYLTTEMGKVEKVAEGIEECTRMGIEVLGPDVNESDVDFTVVGENIRFGLAAARGVGTKAVAAIIEAREKDGPFRDLFELAERVDLRLVNRSVFDALIKAGAMDCFGARRSQLEAVLDHAIAAGQRAQKDRLDGQMSLFGAMNGPAQERPQAPLPDIPEWSEQKLLAGEKETLGLYLSSHPLSSHADKLERFANADTSKLAHMDAGAEVILGGLITGVRTRTTRSGGRMAVFGLEDLKGSVEAVVFDDEIQRLKPLMKPESVVFVRGQLSFRNSGGPSLRATEIIPVEKAAEILTRRVVIRLSTAGLEDAKLSGLRTVMAAHPGPCPVFLDVKDTHGKSAVIRAASSLFVSASDQLVRDVERLLGAGHVMLVGAASGGNPGNGAYRKGRAGGYQGRRNGGANNARRR